MFAGDGLAGSGRAGVSGVFSANLDHDARRKPAFANVTCVPDGRDGGRCQLPEVSAERSVACFTPGTMIATARGEVSVADLRIGDRVVTRDNGIQPILWTGSIPLTAADLRRHPGIRPVLVRKGALGHDRPERDMLVSPNHRMLSQDDRNLLLFDEREVLIAAEDAAGRAGIERVSPAAVTYVHFLFEAHEIVLSDGAWSESFQPGDVTLRGLAEAQRAEICTLFPELLKGAEVFPTARRTLQRHEAVLIGSPVA